MGEEGEEGEGISAGAPSGISTSNRCFMVEVETTQCSPLTSQVTTLLHRAGAAENGGHGTSQNYLEHFYIKFQHFVGQAGPGREQVKNADMSFSVARWAGYFVSLCALQVHGCGSEGETQEPGTNHSPVSPSPHLGPANHSDRSDLRETKLVFIY